MFKEGYQIRDQHALHFLTFTIVGWIDIFTRQQYRDIVINSFNYCRQHKSLRIGAYVIMSNHLHMICSCQQGFELSDALRDFKKFTSTAVVTAIEQNKRESRKSWMLWLLKQKDEILFWQPGNHPEEIRTRDFFRQKLDYIHNNPVRAGIVDKPEEYRYSSARDFYGKQGLIELTHFQ